MEYRTAWQDRPGELRSVTGRLSPSSKAPPEYRIGRRAAQRTRLLAVTAHPTSIGTRPPLPSWTVSMTARPAVCDGRPSDRATRGITSAAIWRPDLFVCSPYKFLGPHCERVLPRSPHDPQEWSCFRDKLTDCRRTRSGSGSASSWGRLPVRAARRARPPAVDFLAALAGTGGWQPPSAPHARVDEGRSKVTRRRAAPRRSSAGSGIFRASSCTHAPPTRTPTCC